MDLKKTLLRLSDVTHGRISSSQTFSDFLAYSALRLSIRTDPVHCKERSERLRRLEANYEESELREFLAELTVICEAVKHNVDVGDWADLFADAYMEVRARNENLKQEFTPKGVAALMSRFVFRDNCALPEKGYFTLSDHACGSGTLLLSSAEYIVNLCQELIYKSQRFWYVALFNNDMHTVREEHLNILDAIIRHDAEAAAAACKKHISVSKVLSILSD